MLHLLLLRLKCWHDWNPVGLWLAGAGNEDTMGCIPVVQKSTPHQQPVLLLLLLRRRACCCTTGCVVPLVALKPRASILGAAAALAAVVTCGWRTAAQAAAAPFVLAPTAKAVAAAKGITETGLQLFSAIHVVSAAGTAAFAPALSKLLITCNCGCKLLTVAEINTYGMPGCPGWQHV